MFLTTAIFSPIKENPLKLLFSFIISLTLSIPTIFFYIFFVHPICMAFKNFLLGMFFLDLELFTATSNQAGERWLSRQRGPSSPRKRLEGHVMHEHHCFAKTPLYPPHFFRIKYAVKA